MCDSAEVIEGAGNDTRKKIGEICDRWALMARSQPVRGACEALVRRIASERADALFLNGDVPYRGAYFGDYRVFEEETRVWRIKFVLSPDSLKAPWFGSQIRWLLPGCRLGLPDAFVITSHTKTQ